MSEFMKSDMNKMMLFMFLGLIFAIFVLGFHKSPKASIATGARLAQEQAGKRTSSSKVSPSRKTYPSNRSNYS